jgi:hypothetical protein
VGGLVLIGNENIQRPVHSYQCLPISWLHIFYGGVGS